MNKRAQIQAKAVQAIKDNNYRNIYVLSPRSGKSKILIDAIREKSDRSIAISAPYNSILESWEIEFAKWDLNFRPLLLNQRSLEELPDNIDLLCLDEIQTLSPAQIEVIKRKKPKYLMGLTGTLGDKNKYRLQQELGLKVVFNYSIEDAIADGIISDYEIFIKYVDITPQEIKKYNELSKNFEYYKQLAFNNPKLTKMKDMAALKRAQYIYRLESKLNAAKELIDSLERVLVFTTLTDVANKLCDYSFHSKSNQSHLDLFKRQRIDKLSVVQQVSMGQTIPDLKHAVIHQIQSNEELQIQKILRTCNLEGDKKAQIYIIVAKDTQDVTWCENALQSTNKGKIKFI